MNWLFQLFSARHTALTESLRIVAEAGYVGVESFRDNFNDPEELKQGLDLYGLQMPSMHINLDPLRQQPEECLRRAREFGVQHIVCPYLEEPDRPTDSSGWVTLAAELSDLAKRWQDAGFTFAWHNHDFEFNKLQDGATPMQLILETATELHWEIDIAWIVKAGVNPANWIEQNASRISAVHMKDIAISGECEDEDGWADLGHGIVPWTSLMPLLNKTPAALYIMEHDNPSDLQRFATRSITSAAALTYS
jgi:sugar phosphate isomerase/epimerase